MTKLQMQEADRIRNTYTDLVTEPFIPNVRGETMFVGAWPYQLNEVDLIKMGWAIKIDQKKILVPEWVKE